METVLPLRSPNLVYGAQSMADADAPVDALPPESLSSPQAATLKISPALSVLASTTRERGLVGCPNIPLPISNRASDVRRPRRPKRYLAHSQEVTATLRNDFRLIVSVTIRQRWPDALNRLRRIAGQPRNAPGQTLDAKRPSRADIRDIRRDGRCVSVKTGVWGTQPETARYL